MVKLADILKTQEIKRQDFDEHKPTSLNKLDTDFHILPAERLYKDLLGLMRQVFIDVLNAKQFNHLATIKDKISLLSEFISKDDSDFLRLIDRYDNSEDYLVIHGVNVCILSLEIARGLNYNREMMLDLGLGAFLHDIGMLKVGDILQEERRLHTAEYEEVKNHVIYGVEILNKTGQENDKISLIISQHHERRDGSGYLKGLSGEHIHEYARIVGLADVYEALIHSRPHRSRLVPFEYETIREIISNRDMFDPYILRIFLERLTRHPAYLLWLATNGIYEILNRQDKMQRKLEIKPQIKSSSKKRYVLSIITLVVILIGLSVLKSGIYRLNKKIFYPSGSSLGIAENRQPLKITYNSADNAASASSISLDLSGINLKGYHFLTFSSKLGNKKADKIRYVTLRIVLEDSRKEAANYYVQGINTKWKEFRIPLLYFENITDWSALGSLSFILQPLDIDSKAGVLYIDKIRFFRKG